MPGVGPGGGGGGTDRGTFFMSEHYCSNVSDLLAVEKNIMVKFRVEQLPCVQVFYGSPVLLVFALYQCLGMRWLEQDVNA